MRIRICDPNPGGQKWSTKFEKKLINFILWSAGCSVLRAEGFSCSLDILYGGPGISKWQFFGSKKDKKFVRCIFFFILWSSKPWIRIGSGSVSGFTWNAGYGSVSGLNDSGSRTELWFREPVLYEMKLCSIHMSAAGLRIRIPWMRIRIRPACHCTTDPERDPAFSLMRIWIQILPLIKMVRICDPFSIDPPSRAPFWVSRALFWAARHPLWASTPLHGYALCLY